MYQLPAQGWKLCFHHYSFSVTQASNKFPFFPVAVSRLIAKAELSPLSPALRKTIRVLHSWHQGLVMYSAFKDSRALFSPSILQLNQGSLDQYNSTNPCIYCQLVGYDTNRNHPKLFKHPQRLKTQPFRSHPGRFHLSSPAHWLLAEVMAAPPHVLPNDLRRTDPFW